MRMKQHLGSWILLTMLLTATSVCAGEHMVTVPWPAPSVPAAEQVAVQFLHLEFRLPRSMVGRVIVHDLGWHNLSILRNPDSTEDILSFGRMNDFWEIYEGLEQKGFFEGLNIHDAESFFDSLAVTPGMPVSESLGFMRDAFSVEDAEYTKSIKGAFTAYRVSSHKHPARNRIYILVTGEKSVYQLTGNISGEEFDALLSGLAPATVY